MFCKRETQLDSVMCDEETEEEPSPREEDKPRHAGKWAGSSRTAFGRMKVDSNGRLQQGYHGQSAGLGGSCLKRPV